MLYNYSEDSPYAFTTKNKFQLKKQILEQFPMGIGIFTSVVKICSLTNIICNIVVSNYITTEMPLQSVSRNTDIYLKKKKMIRNKNISFLSTLSSLYIYFVSLSYHRTIIHTYMIYRNIDNSCNVMKNTQKKSSLIIKFCFHR